MQAGFSVPAANCKTYCKQRNEPPLRRKLETVRGKKSFSDRTGLIGKTSEKRIAMTTIRKKHLDRREWYTDSERSFACLYHRDEAFHGGIGLITFTGLEKPEIVDTPEGPLCIAENGYQWLELVPEDGHFALTAMFHEDVLFQQYIDITLRNEVETSGDAAFDDLLLDVVVLRDGTPRIVDTEELDAALSEGAVTRHEYELARQTADKVAETWKANKTLIEKKLYEYRNLLRGRER